MCLFFVVVVVCFFRILFGCIFVDVGVFGISVCDVGLRCCGVNVFGVFLCLEFLLGVKVLRGSAGLLVCYD